MERRNFLRSILGVAAATALPSEVWPFRKIFLPAQQIVVGHVAITPVYGNWQGLERAVYPGRLSKQELQRILGIMSEPEPAYLLWEASNEQSEAWRRKFKQYDQTFYSEGVWHTNKGLFT